MNKARDLFDTVIVVAKGQMMRVALIIEEWARSTGLGEALLIT